ncbi:TetR family transcriptional regulator [Sphaerisporangium siamense]|uniref:AcrR family transcriptional regulator n=1 Tax=Sphaerisporangium siamense TaxID=795645 RepID=A0A7W7GAU2_9ACTN|nr:TetR/AcrR family transcriptional regulator [Sphaerisporangium siamense]MBB4704363.1 AcrR family transcriptional regulator [Sphaerisporangium siamense]GII84956.1 TetR family transcriptional regulator [Sphaerisporangium siamense]
MRADAQRSRDAILRAARAGFAAHGPDASLEEIARRAGVGSATLHRHFPSRKALLQAVFHDRAETLCAQAGEPSGVPPRDALTTWLRALARYVASTRGLAAALVPEVRATTDNGCHRMIVEAAEDLLRPLRDTGAVRPGATGRDLIAIVTAIADGAADETEADRLVTLALTGVFTSPAP